jgi:hypothetical protein
MKIATLTILCTLLGTVFAGAAESAVKSAVLVHGSFADLERFMAGRAKSQTIELRGSHVIFLSHPKEIAALIVRAAKAAK